MPVERFKSKDAYRKWNAYTHIHGIPTHLETAVVAGKAHKVKHEKVALSTLRRPRVKASRG